MDGVGVMPLVLTGGGGGGVRERPCQWWWRGPPSPQTPVQQTHVRNTSIEIEMWGTVVWGWRLET